MAEELDKRSSRRALLAAAAGGAAALAAQAALPLTVAAADPNDVVLGGDNAANSPTRITNLAEGSSTFIANAAGNGWGVESFSEGSAAIYGVSVDVDGAAGPGDTAYTGVYGYAPASPDPTLAATGVWGDSGDIGVLGTGYYGTLGSGYYGAWGEGHVGVRGEALDSGGYGVIAVAGDLSSQWALRVEGRIRTNRAGRKSVKAGKSSIAVTLAGVTSSSKVFAMLATSESGRWVRAVVPASGKFTIYFNTSLSSSASVSWFVID